MPLCGDGWLAGKFTGSYTTAGESRCLDPVADPPYGPRCSASREPIPLRTRLRRRPRFQDGSGTTVPALPTRCQPRILLHPWACEIDPYPSLGRGALRSRGPQRSPDARPLRGPPGDSGQDCRVLSRLRVPVPCIGQMGYRFTRSGLESDAPLPPSPPHSGLDRVPVEHATGTLGRGT